MIDTKYLRGSDGTGSAVLAHVSVNRLAGATTLKVDNVDNWPPFFIATSGKLNPAGYIIESTKKEFRGHLQGVDIIIDGFEPGFTDEGNTTDQVVIIKQTTGWADGVADNLVDLKAADTTIRTEENTRQKETGADFIASGGLWTGDNYNVNRNASMTALVAYINGQRGTIAAVVSRTFTASRDTYIDVLNTAGVFTLVYTEVTNNAASPALAANSIRLAVIAIGATAGIVSAATINQGQEKYFPIAFGVPYMTTDSLGNLICNRDPAGKTLGMRKMITPWSAPGAGQATVPGLTMTFKSDGIRKTELNAFLTQIYNTTDNVRVDSAIFVDGVAVATNYNRTWNASNGGNGGIVLQARLWLSAGLHTADIRTVAASGQPNIYSDTVAPSFIEAKLG